MEIGVVIGLLVVAVILFATEKVSVDLVTLTLLIVLVLTGILTPKEAFAAFGSDFIIMLASIFIITAAIENSGVMDLATDSISKTKAAKAFGITLWMLPFTALISGLMNNTTLTALMIPPLLSIAKRAQISPSKLLMPMAFASIVGGTWTMIGTSTNIAVNGYLVKEGYASLGLFSLAPIGLVLIGVFVIYMVTVGRFLLPNRSPGKLMEEYKVREYMSEIKMLPGSSLIGQNVYGSALSHSGFKILGIVRNKEKFYPGAESVFQEDDLVLVNGNVKELLKIKDKSGIDILADTLDVFYGTEGENAMQLMEVLVPSRSRLVGRTVKSAKFRQEYGMVVVAIHRGGRVLTEPIGSSVLQPGDLLLVQGTLDKFANFIDKHNLVMLEEHTIDRNRLRKGFITLALFVAAVVVSSLKLIPIEIAFLCAALGTVLLRILKGDEVYHKIDWRMLILIAGMTAFGTAMKNSGADVFISDGLISLFEPLGVRGIMAGFMIITVLLTQPMSNAAAALVVLPVALQSAVALDANPLTFGVAIMLSASVSLITPFEPSCILIYGPGKYKFTDFIRVGGLLTLIMMVVIYFMVPMYWPLNG